MTRTSLLRAAGPVLPRSCPIDLVPPPLLSSLTGDLARALSAAAWDAVHSGARWWARPW